MINIVTNETEIVDSIIDNRTYDIETHKVVIILSKYFYINGERDKLIIREKIIQLLELCDNNFRRVDWQDYIDKVIIKMVSNVRIFKQIPKMFDIDKISIYREELEIINNAKHKKYKKVLFILLVYAKINNLLLDSDEGWVSQDFSNILKEAKMKLGNHKYRLDILKELKEEDIIDVYFNKGKTNIKVKYLSNSGEVGFEVKDFNNAIYQYLIYLDEKWDKCSICGEYFKIKSIKNTSQIYCNKCKKEKQKEWDLQSKRRKRCSLSS